MEELDDAKQIQLASTFRKESVSSLSEVGGAYRRWAVRSTETDPALREYKLTRLEGNYDFEISQANNSVLQQWQHECWRPKLMGSQDGVDGIPVILERVPGPDN